MELTAAPHSLADNMRCLRKRVGISQEELAHRVGLNRGNIASYEKGTAEPKLCNLLRLSDFFGVSIHDFTQRDLSCEQTFASAYKNYLRLNSEEAVALQDFEVKACEFTEVYEGVVRCYDFLVKQEAEPELRVRMADAQFAQLRHLTEAALRAQRELLAFVKCRLKE